ncbi:MAG: N-acetylmuramoyl-L-alanine amidase, partial [Verrucomicrobiae bacterium]
MMALIALCASAHARLSPLAPAPDWSRLDAFQETMTKEDFRALLNRVYAPGGAWTDFISLDGGGATIRRSPGRNPYHLKFAPDAASSKRPPVYWRPRAAIPAPGPGKPLAGLKIALDPGHIGGNWAKMEERWFRVGSSAPVTEGDMTLRVAKLLVPRLQALGAEVFLTRSKSAPVTGARPSQLRGAAVESLKQKGDAATKAAVTKESERLFYRTSEIRRRARLVNEAIRPDVVLCLHFNAEDWGNEKTPRLVNENHLHFLISGSMTREELSCDDQRLEMLVKLLDRSFAEELPLTNAMSGTMAR